MHFGITLICVLENNSGNLHNKPAGNILEKVYY